MSPSEVHPHLLPAVWRTCAPHYLQLFIELLSLPAARASGAPRCPPLLLWLLMYSSVCHGLRCRTAPPHAFFVGTRAVSSENGERDTGQPRRRAVRPPRSLSCASAEVAAVLVFPVTLFTLRSELNSLVLAAGWPGRYSCRKPCGAHLHYWSWVAFAQRPEPETEG